MVIYIIFAFLALCFPVTDFGNTLLIPRETSHLSGILFSPVYHIGSEHLLGNLTLIVPMFFVLRFMYPKVYFRDFIGMYLLSGILLWLLGSRGVHVGGSGVAIAMCFYILFMGIISADLKQLGISILVLMVNLFVYLDFWKEYPGVSQSAHVTGASAGIIVALLSVFWKKYSF